MSVIGALVATGTPKVRAPADARSMAFDSAVPNGRSQGGRDKQPVTRLFHQIPAAGSVVNIPSTYGRRLGKLTPLAVAGLLVACSAASPSRAPVTITGAGSDRSGLVTLDGNYGVAWSFSARPAECLPILTLESPTDGAVLEVIVNDAPGAAGTTNIYGLDNGSYFVEGALNDCGPWSVSLTPQ